MGYALKGQVVAFEHTFVCDGVRDKEPCGAIARTLRWEHSKRIAPRGWRGISQGNERPWFCPRCADARGLK